MTSVQDQLDKNDIDMCWGGGGEKPFSKSSTEVVFRKENNADTSEVLDVEIERIWKQKITENPRVFNGLKFRLETQQVNDDKLTLQLGLTDYRSYLGTAFAPEETVQLAMKEKSHSSSHPFMSHALGVESLLLTSDQWLVFIKRSTDVSEYQGYLCGPGGHAEPKNVVENSKELPHERITEILSEESKQSLILEEVFNSAVDEVAEEVGLPHKTLTNNGIIGIARNTAARGKPDLLFLITTVLSRNEIKAIYDKGEMAEKFESTEIAFVPADDKTALQALLDEGKITPPSAAALICFLKQAV